MNGSYKCRHANYPNSKLKDISCKDCHTSEVQGLEAREIVKKHIKGKFCKRSNNCYKCAYVKRIFNLIRHMASVKNCSKKCEACNNWYYSRYELK